MAKSDLEATFDYYWRALNGPPLEIDYRFHDKRKWELDRAHVQTKIAISIEGGVWTGGRHTRPIGYTNDCIKLNSAALLGWTVFRLTQPMIENEPATHLIPIIQLIKQTEEFIESHSL